MKNIHLKSEVTGIELGKREIKLAGAGREKFDYLISTLPLPEMARLIKNIPPAVAISFKKLRWNSILNLNLGISGGIITTATGPIFPRKIYLSSG